MVRLILSIIIILTGIYNEASRLMDNAVSLCPLTRFLLMVSTISPEHTQLSMVNLVQADRSWIMLKIATYDRFRRSCS